MDRPTKPPTSNTPGASSPDSSLTANTHLDEFMRALLGSASSDDPQSEDVESRLAQVLSDVGLLPTESAPPHVNGTKVDVAEPPGPNRNTMIWRGTTVTRPSTSAGIPRTPQRRWRWRGTSPDKE
jgi:hypothetical protein